MPSSRQPKPVAPRAPLPSGAWLLVSFLLGLAGAGMMAGFLRLFRGCFDPLPQTEIIVLAAGLAGIALGPWLPQGVIGFLSSRLVLRVMGLRPRAPRGTLVLLAIDQPESNEDRKLLLASSCLIAALAMLLMTPLMGPIRVLCEWLRADFYWLPGTLRLADFAVAGAAQLVPASLLGIALLCALGIGNDRLIGRSGSLHLASLALGLGLGFCAALWWCRSTLSSLLILLLSAVPLLLAGIMTLLSAGQEPGHQGPLVGQSQVDKSAGSLPELGHAGLGLLLAGLVVWSLSLSMAGVVWHRGGVLLLELVAVPPCGLVAMWLACLALGAWLASPHLEAASQTTSASGARMCLAGVGTAAAIVLFSAGSQGLPAAPSSPAANGGMLYTAICLHGLSNGQVLPALLRAALSRFATPGLAHATILSTISLAAAAGLLLCGFWLLVAPGTLVTLCAACLLLVIAGGILVIYDPLEMGRPHHWKLAAVFASLLLLIIVLPAAAPGWRLDSNTSPSGPTTPAAQISRTISAASIDRARQAPGINAAPRGEMAGAVDSLLTQCLRGSKVCLIGDAPSHSTLNDEEQQARALQIDHWPHVRGRSFAAANSPLARLRLARQRYDLVIFGPAGLGVRPNQDLWTKETFHRLAGLVAPAGLAVVRIPPAGLEPADIQTVARTFLKAFDGHTFWLVFGADRPAQAELWLIGHGPGRTRATPLVARAAGVPAAKPMRDLLADSESSGIHSAENPRLRAGTGAANPRLGAETAALLSLAGR